MNKQKRKIVLATSFFIIMMSVAVAPAMGSTDLMIKDTTKAFLKDNNFWRPYGTSGGYNSSFLKWNDPGLKFANQQPYYLPREGQMCFPNPFTGNTVCIPNFANAYQCASPEGNSYGACTSFTQSATSDDYAKISKYPVGSDKVGWKWHKGRNVISSKNVAEGTVVATFNGLADYKSSTGCHTAVFDHYQKDSKGYYIGFWVWDQSYYTNDAIIGNHFIKVGGASSTPAGNGNANNYFVVQV